MFGFKKKQETDKEFNYWLKEEIRRCDLFNIDLKEYINPETHPLHAKWIAQALIDGVNPKYVKKLSEVKYTDESIVNNLYDEYLSEIDDEYYVKNYKPDVVKQQKNGTDGWFGAILGDIIGEPFEFKEVLDERKLLQQNNRYTDDTTLSIATYNAIKENHKNPDFVKWYRKMYQEFPNAGYGRGFIVWGSSKKALPGYSSYGNGSAMRVAPIAFYYDNIEDVIRQAVKSAKVTHNHVEGVKGAVVTAVICYMANNGYTKEEIKDYLYKHYYYTDEQLKEKGLVKIMYKLDRPNNLQSSNSLFNSFAVPYAVDMFLNTNSFDECMLKILENFGDTDTICAIAGSIAYTFYKEDRRELIEKYLDDKIRKYL